MSLEIRNATHAIFHLPLFSQRHELKREVPTYRPFTSFTKSLMFAHLTPGSRELGYTFKDPLKILSLCPAFKHEE